MVHISLSPNIQLDDVVAAWGRLIKFWKWDNHLAQDELKNLLRDYLKTNDLYLLNSGRSALYLLLKSLDLQKGDEVILQAFTCNAVANPIMWAGGRPVYADIDKTYNIDVDDIKKKINKNTRAIIVQHTFGIPARVDKIKELAQQHNILLIEDLAHSLGATYKGKRLGTFGDAAFLSFGRDKVISSVYGGALALNNKTLQEQVLYEYKKFEYPSMLWVVQQLLHPIITYPSLLTYRFGGKYLLVAAQRLNLLSYAVHEEERYGAMPQYFPKKMSEPLARLALVQFTKLEKLNNHRKELAKLYSQLLGKHQKYFKIPTDYDEGAIFLRYPIAHKDAKEIIKELKTFGYILGDWYKEVIAPHGTRFKRMGYTEGSCSAAEGVAAHIVNLPTNIRTSKKEAKEIVQLIISYY